MSDNMLKLSKAMQLVQKELQDAERQYPGWPEDVVHGAAIMTEEAGETLQAALDVVYKKSPNKNVIKEAAQTGAMALRLIVALLPDEEPK